MKASELAGLIGREGSLRLVDLQIAVKVIDARPNFGTIQYLVAPVAGGGEAWVEARRVELEEETGR